MFIWSLLPQTCDIHAWLMKLGKRKARIVKADYGCVNSNTQIPDCYLRGYLTLNKGRLSSYFWITYSVELFAEVLVLIEYHEKSGFRMFQVFKCSSFGSTYTDFKLFHAKYSFLCFFRNFRLEWKTMICLSPSSTEIRPQPKVRRIQSPP